jgi:hypothetical protein
MLCGLFASCQPENIDADCSSVWEVNATATYSIAHQNGFVDFDILNPTEQQFLVYQSSNRPLSSNNDMIAFSFRLRDLTASSQTSAVGENVRLFIGYRDGDRIVPHIGVSFSRAQIFFEREGGYSRTAFFNPIGAFIYYDISFNKSVSGLLSIRVQNIITQAVVDDALEFDMVGKVPIFGIMVNSRNDPRFGLLDQVSFRLETIDFRNGFGFTNDLFECFEP